MSQRVRIGIIIGVIGIALAVLGLFALSRIVRQNLAPLPPPTQELPTTEQVVVTTHDIPLGTVLKTEDLRLAEVPIEMVPNGALQDVQGAVGRFSKVDLVSGEMLLLHHLADPTNVNHDVAYTIEDYQVMMAFPADDLMSTLNVIQRGDLVDIFVSVNQDVPVSPEDQARLSASGSDQQEETKLFTFDAMQRIVVTAMVVDVVQQEQQGNTISLTGQGTPQPTPAPKVTRTRAYLLALVPQDALVLKHLKDVGATFDIVLRAPTSDQIFEQNPVTSEYLIDRYQLEGAP